MIVNVKETTCFFCYKNINGKAVMWEDMDQQEIIILHPKCACMLGERLIGDAFEADKNVQEVSTVHMLIDDRIRYRLKREL